MSITLEESASHIVDGLWLGNHEAVKSTDADIIVTILSEEEVRDYRVDKHVGSREWHIFSVDDREEEDISQHFRAAHTVLRDALALGRTVLVHCAYGISRSPSIVIAYLMLENGWTRKKAFEFVSKRRPIIAPNDGFMDKLLKLE